MNFPKTNEKETHKCAYCVCLKRTKKRKKNDFDDVGSNLTTSKSIKFVNKNKRKFDQWGHKIYFECPEKKK